MAEPKYKISYIEPAPFPSSDSPYLAANNDNAPLHLAETSGYMELLSTKGTSTEAMSKRNCTPLHIFQY